MDQIAQPIKTQQNDQAQVVVETVAAIVVSRTLTEAALVLKINRSTLYDRIKKYNLKTVLDPFIEQAFYSLKMGSVRAAEELVQQLDNSNVHIRTEAAKEILNRVGVTEGALVAHEQNEINRVKTPYEQILELSEEEVDRIVNRQSFYSKEVEQASK